MSNVWLPSVIECLFNWWLPPSLGAVWTDPNKVMDCACIYFTSVSKAFVGIKYLSDLYCARLGTNKQAENRRAPQTISPNAVGGSQLQDTKIRDWKLQSNMCQCPKGSSMVCLNSAVRWVCQLIVTAVQRLQVQDACHATSDISCLTCSLFLPVASPFRNLGEKHFFSTDCTPCSEHCNQRRLYLRMETSQVWLCLHQKLCPTVPW